MKEMRTLNGYEIVDAKSRGDIEGLRTYVTPKMFGAKGDGVTDDTVALNNAFAHAAEHNMKCFIPKGVYNVSPVIANGELTYCFDIPSGLNIEGADRDETVLRVVTTKTSYTSVFSNPNKDHHVANVSIQNLTIEQDPEAESDGLRENGSRNKRYAIHTTAICENMLIHNIYFKNCCGINTIIFGNVASHNVKVSSCLFDYRIVKGVTWYDRSVLYMNCHDYLVENNVINGNFETLGGLELHGYNGTARNNLFRECYTGINVALDYDPAVNTSGIFVSENRFDNNVKGVTIWGNHSENPPVDNIDISICNNMITADGAIIAGKYQNYDGMGTNNQRLSGIDLNQGITAPYKALRIIGNSIIFKNTKKISGLSSIVSPGIGIYGVADVDGVTISQNYIEGCVGNGIKIGTTSNSVVKTFKNITVTDNILKDCGRIADSQANYLAYILLSHGNKENIFIKNNILEKTDSDINTWSAFYNHSSDSFTHQEVYFSKDNIIRSPSKYDMKITNAGKSNVLYDEGATEQRPTIAKAGFRFYDTTQGKLFVFNGTDWELFTTSSEYELLETITTTEELASIASTNNIACSELLCKVTIPPSSIKADVGIYSSFGYVGGLPNGLREGDKTSYLTFRIFPRNGYYSAEATTPADFDTFFGALYGIGLANANKYPSNTDLRTVSINAIGTGKTFPSGTILEIWGVKK